MSEMKFNERKFQFLSIIDKQGSITSTKLAKILNLALHHASYLLKKYHDFNYLRRYWLKSGKYRYYLTKKGKRVLRKYRMLSERGLPLKIAYL
jgi:predicted transcriptional regulator